ncbi:MAG: TonB-dependent receptor [Bacteroidales bacterium]|nr:TonB-dependent receptor [Bacteroidales bacterium]
MLKRLKSVSMMLFLMGASAGAAYAAASPGVADVKITQQSGTCTGIVKDATGESIIGASVVVKGTTNGTITGIDGDFSLSNVKNGDVIQISFVGYKTQEIKFNGQPLNVILQDDTEVLDEVVVTGYGGSQKRGALTTAISKVDNSVLKNAAYGNAGQALQGSVTGLRVTNVSGQPGSNPQIVLRGGATIEGTSANALVIVDGIVRNSMSDVNPEDIASMQVLKDAASTAIYGARANGGVILIETKSGKQGKASVNYKFKIGVNKARKGYDYLDAHDYIYYNRLGMKRTNSAVSGYSSGYSLDGQMGYGVGNTSFDIRYLTDETAHLKNEGWSVMDDPYYEGSQLLYRDYGGLLDNDVFNDSALTQEHYLNISGGNEHGTFVASTGYYKEDGQVIGTGYKRFTGNVNGTYQVLPFLKVKAGASVMWSTQPSLWISNTQFFYRTRSARPNWNPYDEEGNPVSGFGTADGNPAYYRDKYHDANSTTKYTFNGGFTADIIKDHLILDANASLLNYEYQDENGWDAYQQQNQSSPNTSRYSTVVINKYHQIQTSATLTYKNTFNDAHDLNVMLGGEYYTYDRFRLVEYGYGAPTDDVHTMNVIPTFVAGYTDTGTTGSGTYKTAYRILSAFGRAEYNYKMRYMLAFTARYDGVSRLDENRWGFFPGVSAGWNVTQEEFWQDSKLADFITTLKPRVSFGTNGNVNDLGNYEVYGTYATASGDYGAGTYGGSSAIVNTELVNTGLRWEQSRTFEVGLDLGILNNRVSFILDYYNRQTKDLLTKLTLPGYTGFKTIRTNLGTLRNSGFEAEVRANIINKGGFTWDMTANVTTVANKILKLPTNQNERNRTGGYEVAAGPMNADGTYNTKWVGGYQEGGKLGEITAYVQNHIYRDWDDVRANSNMTVDEVGKLYGPGLKNEINPTTGLTYEKSSGWKPIEPGDVCWEDMDNDGKITTYDRKVIGNYLPNITGGFSTTFGYKGISLYARFDYALGHTLYNDLLARSLGQYQGSFNIISEVKNSWSEENPNTDLPKFYYADQLAKYNITRSNNAVAALDNNSSRFYEKADYLACREITLSYQLPKKLISKFMLQDASVYVTGQNLFYITGYSGTSPEPAFSSSVVTGGTQNNGVDDGRYPTPRTFLFGLSLTF